MPTIVIRHRIPRHWISEIGYMPGTSICYAWSICREYEYVVSSRVSHLYAIDRCRLTYRARDWRWYSLSRRQLLRDLDIVKDIREPKQPHIFLSQSSLFFVWNPKGFFAVRINFYEQINIEYFILILMLYQKRIKVTNYFSVSRKFYKKITNS